MQGAKGVTVAVKYCGGCNPYYDAAEAKQAAEKIIGRTLEPWSGEALPDICLLVKQCRSDCFAAPERFSRHGTYLLENEGDIKPTGDAIREHIRELGQRRAQEREE